MRRLVLSLAMLALMFGAVEQAKADLIFEFSYSDAAGNEAKGTLNAVDSGLGDGSLHVISGILNVTSSADADGSVGTYSLLPAGPAVTPSGSGFFLVDNLIYPNNDAASGVNPGFAANPSFLTNFGLLFGPPGTGSQAEVNIWGNGNGDYAFYTFNNGNYNIQQGSGGSFSLTAVPEPATLAVFGLCTIVAGAHGVRRRKRLV